MTNRIFKLFLGVACFVGLGQSMQAQEVPFTPRLNDGGNTYLNIKGDYTFLSNSVMNSVSNGHDVNTPYNGNGSNNSLHVEYVDIDSDPSTFNSSSSTLSLPSCSQIYWAGLYWAGNYDVERDGDHRSRYVSGYTDDPNHYDVTQVKFRVPGSSTYIDLQADTAADPVGEEDDIIVNGYNTLPNDPYVCYKNVTNVLQGLADPTGDYFVGNVRGTRGATTYGCAGWTLVVIYENPTLPGKYISVFDGYEGITTQSGNSTADITVSGFNTIPTGPVNARIGVSTLEGETSLSGDTFGIVSNSSASFTDISDAANPNNNFFNSTISEDGANVTTRNVSSTNAIGFDSDVFDLNNPSNSIIDNGDTSATLRLGTSGDWFASFLVTFGVEIIEPTIVLEKKVEDIGGNDITGLGVNLGQYLDYVLSFVNTGNDDATNYTIRDILPANVTLDETTITMPAGVTYTYDSSTREVVFNIPDNLVEEGDPVSEIRMRVRVAENCFDFIDACTDIIENLAYSTYEGIINSNQISDDPSVSDFDDCGFTTPGATNFLLDDLSACNFTRTVQLCGDDVLLDAGDNFDAYVWYRDENGNNLIDGSDTVLNDGDPDGDPSTFLVSETGTFMVDKQVADPCKDFTEIIIVELFGTTQTNPITALINDTSNTVDGEIVVCPNDGAELPEIFLCGLNDTELIQVNIPDADSIEWEQLDESSCPAGTQDCANTDNSCTWNVVDTGNDFLASDAGQYRMVINYQNGCFSRFFFNIYKNPLDPQYTSRDIICNSDGNITVTNMPIDYEFRLIDQTTSTVLVPYNANPSFDITTNGAYMVEMRQQGVTDGCVFVLDNIGILNRDFQVDVVPRDTDCNGLGEIAISILNVEPQYYYEISQGGTVVDTFGPSADNNYTFENLNDGVYDVDISTDDGCVYSEQVTINDLTDLDLTARVSQHITCREGNIQMDSSGGQTPHTYAIWSYVNESGTTITSYPTVGDIPASAYQTSVIFDILDPGDYTFVVVDRNNCHSISNTVTIYFEPSVDYTTTATDETCFGAEDGTISFNLISTNGYQVEFFLIDDATGLEIASNTSGLFTNLPQGDYTVRLNQRKGSASCDYFENYSISGPTSGVSGDAVLIQDYTCLQDGIIEAQNVVGGTPPYEYSIDGVNFVSGAGAETFSNLTNGSYAITIRDANNCTFTTNSIVLDPLNPPTDLTFSATTPSCPTLTSDVTVTVVDGNTPFVFEITAPAAVAATSTTGNSADFDGLAPGTYTFRVTDDKGCVYDESFTINPVSQIAVAGNLVSNVTCFNDTDGEVDFAVSDFNTDYNYSVTGPSNFSGNNQTGGTISLTGLDDGTYTIIVTDNLTGCTATTDVTVNAPAAALTLAAAETQPTCPTDGSVILTSTGGWGGNTFTLTNPDTSVFGTNSTGQFNGLSQAGTYTATVTDANGCVVNTNFTLNAAVPPVMAIVPNDTCYDDAVGLTLTANVTSGGDGNYQYSLNGGAFGPANVFTGLTSGTYTIDVQDGNNCTDSASITINPELTVSATAANITACGTDTDVDIVAAGGDGNYVYAIVADGVTPTGGDFAATNPVTLTGAGDYDVYVRDNNGGTGFCEASFDITVVQDAPLTITPSFTPVSCFGGSDGSISMVAAGGEAPYEYSIDNGANYQVSGNFVNLSQGTYNLRIRDANNCETTGTITVTEPNQLVAEAQQTQSYTCLQLGEISVGSVTPTSGGSGDYQYNINGGPWTASTTGGTIFTGLTDGTYSIQVRDANAIGCTITLPDVIIAPLPAEPTLSTSITYNCDGTGEITVLPNDPTYTYSLNSGAFQANNLFSGVAVGTHTIDVDYGSDCIVQTTVTVEPGNAFNSSITAFSDISCNAGTDGSITFEVENFDAVNGFEYQVNGGGYSAPQMASPITIPGLAAGNYTIEVRDVLDNSCIVTLNQTLSEPTPVVASASITSVMTCTNGGATITASAAGGTPAYEYQLEDNIGTVLTAYQTSNVFAGLAAGDYIVRARDTNLCEDPIDAAITVVAPTPITFTSTETACYSGSNDGTIQVDVTAGNGDYQFSLNGGPWITPTPATATTHTFVGLAAGNYTINVRDGFGCTGTLQNVTINDALVATVDVVDISTCADGSITVTASGGVPTLEYAFVPTTTSPTGLFSTTNTFAVTAGNDGDYDVYVRDNSATVPFCEFMETVTVNPATPLTVTNTPTDPDCHDGTGSIEVDIASGIAPFTIQIVDLDNGGAGNLTDTNVLVTNRTYYNLLTGDYTVTITDSTGCTVSETPINIANPDELTATILGVTPASCTGDPNDFGFEFTAYPGTLGTIEFSADGGATWIGDNSVPGTTDRFTGYNSGDVVNPSMRTVDGLGNTVCQTDFPPFIIPYPLDDLDITIAAIIVNCNELQVTVQGSQGTPNYQYTYSDDPMNFDPVTPAVSWSTPARGLADPEIFTGLVPGRTYVFYVRDAAGCVRQSNVNVNDLITVPLEITSSFTPSCDGASNGSITYTVTDNQAPFGTEFRWTVYDMTTGVPVAVANSGGNVPYTSPQDVTVNGLGAGNYFIEVVEVDGGVDSCVGATENELLEELDPLTGTPVVLQNISCDNPGLIQVQSPFGGGGTYTYTVTGPAPFVTITSTSDNPIEIPANSPAGNYDVTMEDQYGCSSPLGTVALTLTPNPTIDSTNVDNCSDPATVTINATSGAAQIFYSLDGGATYLDNGGVFNNVSAGTYNISILDSNGCTDAGMVTVHPVLEVDVALTKLLDCSVSPDAEITIEVLAGSGDYDYQITDGGGTVVARTALPSNPFVFSTTTVENYSITVFDNLTSTPCTRVFNIPVVPAVMPTFNITSTSDVTCNGAHDGTIDVAAVDAGTGPYTFEIISGPGSSAVFPIAPTTSNATTASFTGLEGTAAGITYTIEITAANGCTSTQTQTITQPDVLANINTSVVEFGCATGNNMDNATITVDTASITGGSGNYVIYEFINDQGTVPTGDDVVVQVGPNNVYTETNTAGGSYIINVYDDNGCEGTVAETIDPFDELVSAAIAVDAVATCVTGEDITITANGSITNSTATPVNYEFRLLPAGVFQASGSFTGLAVGTHNFEVRNTVTGCVLATSHTVADPEVLDLVVTNTTDITCFGDTNGTVELDLQDAATITYASATTYTLYYDINNTPGNLADDVVTAGGDADGNFTITGLAAGNYFIEVTDTNPPGSACVYTEAFAIGGPSAGISANTQVTQVTCALNDGIIEVINPAGGWGGYTYFVDLASNPAPTFPGSYQVSPQFTGLAGGGGAGTDYQVWVADSSGCEFQLPNVNLVDPTPITATLQINQENCTALQGEIEVVGTAGGQGGNYTYQLVRNGGDLGSPQTATVFSGLGAGSYEVRITDQWSCTTTVGPVVLLDEMVATATVVKPIDCTVDPGGHITINVTGGSANLTFDVLFPDGFTTANNATGVFTGLTQAGTYTFTITDGNTVTPCVVVITQDLDAPVSPVINDVIMDPVNCNGGSDGSLTVELDPITTVNPVYTYELYEMSNLAVPYRVAQTSNVFDNLPQGDYRVRVISGRSCDDFFDQTVTEPTALMTSASATAFVCNANNAVNTSTITVTASGGTGPYLYSIDNVNFQASNTFEIVDNGAVQNITAYVTDANACAQTAVVAPIQPINVFTTAVSQNIAISCASPEEVLVTVTDDGNPGNTYTFELLPVGNPSGSLTATPTNVTANFELTQPGSYTFRITDNATGCYVDTAPYDIAPYDLIEVVATPTAPAVCFGDTNGALEINVTGYTGAYDYEVFNASGVTTGVTGSANTTTNPLSIPGFPGGNYFVRVTQTANPLCVEDSNTITIASPDMALAATPIEVANVTCANNLGEIEVSPTGGFAPYNIQLTNTTTAQVYNMTNVVSFVFQGLSAGLFDVEITDSAGCVINEPITLVQPTPITADIDATPTNLVCFGDTNATVSAINVLNGRGVYQYVLNIYDTTGTTIVSNSGAQSNPVFNNLGAGVYSITVSDGWSCDVETAQVTITEPVEVFANLVQLSQLTCTTQAQIELTASGGTGPYEYSTDGVLYNNMAGGNTHTFSVPAGSYQYFVRDAFGCDAMISNQVTVEPIVPLDVIIDDSAATINCTGEASATIIADAVGGLGNYSYELFSDPGLTSSVAGPQTNGDFRGLIAGTYYVHVTSMDCQVTSAAIDIIDPAPLQIDRQESTDVTCSGLEDGTITVEVSGGTGDIYYAITPNLDQFDTVGTFEDLAPGIYDVIAQDRNGCFETFQFEILQPEPLQAQAINVMHEVCFNSADGEFELDITGGTAPYFSSLNSNADTDYIQDQVLFQNLPAGMHVVFVRDAQGCETNVIVEINPGVNLVAEVTPIYECDGNLPTNRLDIVFEDTSVIADVMYAIDSTDPADLQLTSDFMNIAPGDHFLTIAHANGCINTIDFSITGYEPLTLVLENSNINEITAVAAGGLEDYTFIFDGVDNGTDNTYIINRTDTYVVTVIDQNGCEVTMEIFMEFIDIEVPDFFTPDGDGLNDTWLPDNLEAFPNVLMIIFDRYGRELYRMRYGDTGWDGIYNNSELPTGDYWYIIKLQGENDDRELVGHFTLYRQ
ncbi:T9SS type B sorting domain-containing protein [Flagellimonas myxillae]|uniref:T9SS type B sorting domain-containing protein n=1 Tax=Flagellimonas myxillae TaxID=2942214 RepID=UPI00201EA901|nr:T9SS type B sorting domain-containing protein [Muricauda myxillae]MCL6266633.1 T9SS type B sorting domain-containing protein [Muricauda myxillae]